MSAFIRQFRRAPGRILASVFALALAVGAIGVLAIPTVSEGTLHEAVERDGLPDVIVATTPLDDDDLGRLRSVAGVVAAEGQAVASVELADGSNAQLVGLPFADQTMDLVQLTAGRLPAGAQEVVTSPSVGAIGDSVLAGGRTFDIVGHGSTLWWTADDALFADVAAVASVTGGANRLVVTAADDSEAELSALGERLRDALRVDGHAFLEFPVNLADGSTPIDDDISQVSMLIGLLGIFAAMVALVLLAGTTNTLITERTREVAVMRALGGRTRPIRRRLRRIALGITAAALVIGLPLGVVISNVIARMVLEEFVGVTPDVAVDWTVLAASAVGALVAARIVSAGAARRVTNVPLAEALRDRDGAPFGGRWHHRALTRLWLGGLLGRMAIRTSARRPGRTIAVTTQVAAAVGATFLIPSLVTSVNDFNTATLAPWTWETRALARDAGLPLPAADDEVTESGVSTFGEIDDWEVGVYGLRPDTKFFSAAVVDGRWLAPAAREAMISDGFARRRGIAVGDTIDLELASGFVDYRVVGTLDDANVAVYVDRDDVATDLGAPGMANVVWSSAASPAYDLDRPVSIDTATELAAEDAAGRDAILLIFGAIGVIVAGVSALAVLSSMTVSLFERRHELAVLQAIGTRRRRLRGLLARELIPIGAVGVVLGLGVGAVGARGIIASFESAEAIDIGTTYAVGAVPFIVVGTTVSLLGLAAIVVRSASRRSIASMLRGAA